jgi:hypothetical protein
MNLKPIQPGALTRLSKELSMKIVKSDYHVAIRIDPYNLYAGMPHARLVSVGEMLIKEIEQAGVNVENASVAWNEAYLCEFCDEPLTFTGNELKCNRCGAAMCHSCNRGTKRKPICEDCRDKEK